MPKCEFCGSEEDVEYVDLGGMYYICRECLERNYMQCDRCGAWNDPSDLFKYYDLKTGECVCQDCYNPDKDVIEDVHG